MSKNYISISLHKGNVKKSVECTNKEGKKYIREVISMPKLGLLWVNKSQTVANKENKNLTVLLSEDRVYSFYQGKDKDAIKMTGREVYDHYQTLWQTSKDAPVDKKVYVSTRIVESKKTQNIEDSEVASALEESETDALASKSGFSYDFDDIDTAEESDSLSQ